MQNQPDTPFIKVFAEAFLIGLASTAGMYVFIAAMQPQNKAKIKAFVKQTIDLTKVDPARVT